MKTTNILATMIQVKYRQFFQFGIGIAETRKTSNSTKQSKNCLIWNRKESHSLAKNLLIVTLSWNQNCSCQEIVKNQIILFGIAKKQNLKQS